MFLFRFGVGVVAVSGIFVFNLLLSGLVFRFFVCSGLFCCFVWGIFCLFVCGGLVVCFVFVLGSFFIFIWMGG